MPIDPRLRLRTRSGRRRRLTLPQALLAVGLLTTASVVVAGTLVTFTDPEVFPHVGVALWWAVSTVTTVGYGDVVPLSGVGRLIGTALTFGGIGAVAFLTAIAASAIVVGEVKGEEMQIERQEDLLLTRVEELTSRLRRIEDLLDPTPDPRRTAPTPPDGSPDHDQ